MAWGGMGGEGWASNVLAQLLSAACPRLHPSPLGFTPSLHLRSPGSLGTHSGYPAPADRWRAQLRLLLCFPTSLTSKRPTMPFMQFSGTLNSHVEYSSDVKLHLAMMGRPWLYQDRCLYFRISHPSFSSVPSWQWVSLLQSGALESPSGASLYPRLSLFWSFLMSEIDKKIILYCGKMQNRRLFLLRDKQNSIEEKITFLVAQFTSKKVNEKETLGGKIMRQGTISGAE